MTKLLSLSEVKWTLSCHLNLGREGHVYVYASKEPEGMGYSNGSGVESPTFSYEDFSTTSPEEFEGRMVELGLLRRREEIAMHDKCQSCGKDIVKVQDENGTWQCLDAVAPVYVLQHPDLQPGQPIPPGATCKRVRSAMVTHFATCPNASRHSKKSRSSQTEHPDGKLIDALIRIDEDEDLEVSSTDSGLLDTIRKHEDLFRKKGLSGAQRRWAEQIRVRYSE